jgi:glycosyl transferase, family 25
VTIGGMDGLAIWVINLDRATDRLARISARLSTLGLPFTRLPAVDARALTPAQRAAFDEAAYRRKHGMAPVAGEIGCYLSHIEVMRAFVAEAAPFALVLEDDVLLGDTLPAVLRALMAHPGRWDMVKLSAVHSGTPVPVLDLTAGHKLAVMLSRCTGSSAYLINRRTAEAYLRREGGLLPMQLPYDHVFDRGWDLGLKVRLVTPTPCTHDEHIASTIEMPRTRRKFHWTRRLPAFRWRLASELQRVAYGLKHMLRERLLRAG